MRMKTDWLKTVNDINSRRFVIPPGWYTRDQVAEDLKCDPAKVGDLLKPGIDSGDIERQAFSVWDPGRRLAVSVVCYRKVSGAETKTTENQPAKPVKPAAKTDVESRVIAAIRANPTYTDYKISRNYRGINASDVARIRASLTRK